MILPIALTTAGAAALINLWLGMRIGRIRATSRGLLPSPIEIFSVTRMRAQLNFAEYAPIVLILIGLVEMAVGTQLWLWVVASVFIIGRVLHAFGMDGRMLARQIGIGTTFAIMIGLGLYAVAIPYLTPASAPVVGTIQLN